MHAAEFVSLADLLRPAAPPPAPVLAPVPAEECAGVVAADVAPPDVVDVLREARLFRARLIDAAADAFARLLTELASEVLARELRSAPCDLEAIVARVAARAPIVRVRVAQDDVARITGAAVVADPDLRPGDAIVELADGAIDARLGVRVAAVLEAFA
jgi:flagellar biosynthesis/type III secretory pathway protein FliH